MTKDANPGCLDLSTGGVFAPDEHHLENAERELEEELGLRTDLPKTSFRFVCTRPYVDHWTRQFSYLYFLRVYDDHVFANVRLQEAEVEGIEFMSIGEIEQRY